MGQSETLDSVNFFNVHMAGQETAIKIGIADLVIKLGFYVLDNAKAEFLDHRDANAVGILDVSTVIMLIYSIFPLLLIAGAKKGQRKLMIPWLVLGWLQVALVFITLGIFLLALCVSQDIRVHLNVRQAFFMYLAASIYTGWNYFSLQIVGKSFNAMSMPAENGQIMA